MTVDEPISLLSEDPNGEVKLRKYPKDPWGEANMREIRRAWDLSPEQEENLMDLKQRLSDIDHFKNEPETVLKFMIAPTGFHAAEGLFRKMIAWRLKNNVDTILQDFRPPQAVLESVHATILDGADKDGDVIFCERGGAMDAGKILRDLGKEQAIKCGIWIRELHTRGAWVDDFEKRKGSKIKAVTVVYDLKGLSSKHLNPKVLDLFGELMHLTMDYYPGPFKRIIVCRAPSLFPYVWAIVKNFLRKSARDKMIFPSGKSYLSVLDQYIDRHVLPECIAEGGCGGSAVGLPNIIGDNSPNPWWDAHSPLPTGSSDRRKANKTSSLDGRSELTETDECSMTSEEGSTGGVFVSSSPIVKGYWEERINGGRRIYTRL